jgi:hypothetical protein
VIIPHDIVDRLLHKKPYWFHGKPKIELIGQDNSFGKLRFDFSDQVIEYNVFIYDRNHILDAAHFAIENFVQIASEEVCRADLMGVQNGRRTNS